MSRHPQYTPRSRYIKPRRQSTWWAARRSLLVSHLLPWKGFCFWLWSTRSARILCKEVELACHFLQDPPFYHKLLPKIWRQDWKVWKPYSNNIENLGHQLCRILSSQFRQLLRYSISTSQIMNFCTQSAPKYSFNESGVASSTVHSKYRSHQKLHFLLSAWSHHCLARR